jgi:DNA helicase-2/ATP-dependent DNA helicase PcrA
MRNELLQKLTPSQKKAVLHIEGPLLVIAGPGSGKTRVITHRIAALVDSGVQPNNICAITFTNKAADEMRQRAVTLGASGDGPRFAGAQPHISTFHFLCVRILRRYAEEAGINPNFSIYDESDQAGCIKQAVKDCELDTTNFPPARMLENISELKNKLIDADAFKTEAGDFLARTIGKIYARYQCILTENNALDFDDLLMKTAFLLKDRPDVCSEISNRFKFLLIDEYQDTNHAQYKIAKALVSEHNNIFAAGDPDQSIYRWRGADIRNIMEFEKDWPDAVVVKLEENFRSRPEILEKADKLIEYNQNRKPKKLIPTKPPSADIAVTEFEDDQQEAEGIAQKVKELTEVGAALREIAVFYRVNSMSRTIEEAFIRNKIPYQMVRGVEFYSRKEIRDVLAYLKILVNPSDEAAMLRIINTPARGIGKTTIEKFQVYARLHNIILYKALKKADEVESLPKAAKAKIAVFVDMLEQFKKDVGGKVALLVEQVFVESGLKKSLEAAGADNENALENVNELISAASLYDQQVEQPTLLDYLQQTALFSDVDAYDTAAERVALMTLHTAKGLEFENVFIVGLEEGLLPHERSANDDEELDEERRLVFVGITRAKQGLYVSYSRYRTIRGQTLRTIPSQFIRELGAMSVDTVDGNHPSYDDVDAQIAPEFAPGQLVRHKVFGLGTVKEFIDMGENSIVTVAFNTGQTKTLMLKYARLAKI